MNKNIYDYGILMPESTDFETMPEELQEQINLLGAEWPKFPAINTRFFDGFGLIYLRLKQKLTKEDLDTLITSFGLSWAVLGIRSAYKINKVSEGLTDGVEQFTFDYDTLLELPSDGSILNYANDIQETDIDANQTSRRPSLDDDIYISTYSGTDPIKL